MSGQLRVTEIFHSLQGEGLSAGAPTVFVRLTRCPLRCQYCDTAYAFAGGEMKTPEEICRRVAEFSPHHVCVTGGEPLAQENCPDLLRRLCDQGWRVSLETSGALPVEPVDKRVVIVMDIKTPGSGEVDKNRWENLRHLADKDQIKFVICDEADYRWARERVRERKLDGRVGAVLFSPSYHQLQPVRLAEWILRDRLPVRLQLQQHKLLWGEAPGH